MYRLLVLISLTILLFSQSLTAQYSFKKTPLQGLPKRYQTRPTRISDSGMMTGSCLVANGFPHACVWSPDGTVQEVGTLGGSESFGSAVNDQQRVVGYSFLAGDEQRVAFVWTVADGFTVIPTIDRKGSVGLRAGRGTVGLHARLGSPGERLPGAQS